LKDFAQNWLDIQCQSIEGVNSALFLLSDTAIKGLRPAAQWPQNSKEPLELVAIARMTIKSKKHVINSNISSAAGNALTFDYIALPIYIENQLLGIVAVKTTHHDALIQQKILQALQVGSKWLAMPQAETANQDHFYQTVVKLVVNCLQQNSLNKAFSVLISSFTQEFACERVSIGMIRGYHAKIIALSNSAKFDDRTDLMRIISAAMDEAVDQDQIVIYPALSDEQKLISHAHAELARKFGSGAICTIPFVYDQTVFAVLTLERSETNPFDQETVALCEQTLSILAPFLKLKQNDEEILLRKLAKSVQNLLEQIFGYRYLGVKLMMLSVTTLLVVAGLVNGDFRINADAVLEGKIQRSVSAPMAGFIRSAKVRAGDTVLQNEVIATMEDSDLKLEKIKLDGQLQQIKREYREAMANRELVQVGVLNAQIAQIDAQRKLKQEQLQRTMIRAPFEGVVIEGDLSQSLGAPVEKGDSLFTVAPLDGYRVILKVNERDISYIRHGQPGTLALSSLPDRKFPLQIEKITQVASIDDRTNIFRVEASLADTPKLLRPGMEGIGKVEIGRSKLLWIWTHELIDWFKLWVWSWWP
jgi:RND family efflux transporter MFP subunit